MSRVLLQYVLPLLLPTLIFVLWTWFTRHHGSAQGTISKLQEGPWFWLILAGVALMAAGLIHTALTAGGEAGSRYIAPRYEDGRVVPGRIE